MATVNLLPNADISNNWTLGSGFSVYGLLNTDNTGYPPMDAGQIKTTAAGRKCVVQFQDFDDTDVIRIDYVQAVLKVGLVSRGHSYTIGMTITNNGSGSAAWAEETINDTASSGWNTNTFTSRATSTSGGSNWNPTDIDNIAMEIHAHTMSGDTLRVTYAYFIVTFTIAAVTDNATFFGANF